VGLLLFVIISLQDIHLGKFNEAAGYYHCYVDNNIYMAIELLERALTLSRSCGDTDTQCSMLSTIAEIRCRKGDAANAQTHLNEARRLAKLSGNLYQEAWAFRVAARCTSQLGAYRKSIDYLRRAKQLVGICGMQGGSFDSDIKIVEAQVHLLKSEYTDARSIHSQILQNSDQDPHECAWALVNIAEIDVMTGATESTVQKNLNEAKTIFSNMKYFGGVICCEMILADLRLREGDISAAKNTLQDCLNLCWGKENDVVSFCLERFADRNRWDSMESRSPWLVGCLTLGHKSKDKLALHKALLLFGDLFISHGDNYTAHSLVTVAMEGFVFMDVHRSRAQCLLRLGDLANKKGNFSEAAEHWTAARPLFKTSSQAKDVARIDARLTELEHNQKALMQLATLRPPDMVIDELSLELETSRIEQGEGAAGQKSVLSDMQFSIFLSSCQVPLSSNQYLCGTFSPSIYPGVIC
jgi:tetratricopeptide (TPR) repeat protein